MSLLARVEAVQGLQPERFGPFVISGQPAGFVSRELSALLQDELPDLVSGRAGALHLDNRFNDFEARSGALARISDCLLRHDQMAAPRNEIYAIRNHWGDSPLAGVERNLTTPLGLVAYGVNLHAWTRDDAGRMLLWVGRRSKQKQFEPGKLDHLAAGGQPMGIGLKENIIKEAGEEASVPEQLAARCKPVGAVTGHYHRETCRRFVHYNFDLELPPDFQPMPSDGEVDEFWLMSPDAVIETLRSGDSFDLESAIAVIDWLIRRGFIHAENEPDFDQVLAGLRADLFRF